MDIKQQINILLRGVSDIVSLEELKQKLLTGKPLTIKLGVDPTSKDLHLGHTVILRKLRQFQDLGHRIIFIIGDFTAKIGDPSGRDTTRPLLTEEEILQNAKTYQEQVFKILDKSKTEIVYNSKWLNLIGIEGLLKLCSKYTVARMLERDDFEKRFKNNVPITILEFIYPLLQGYDSVAIKSDVELGGNDQKFNLIVGRELQKDAGQSPQVIMTMPLLEGTDGVLKMSKSYKNYISITDSPKDMFGKIMSIPDSLMLRYYELLTDEDVEEVKHFCETDPRNAKSKLAYLIVKQYYDKTTAEIQKEEFDNVFKEKKVPEDIKELRLKSQKYELVDLINKTGIIKSRSEIKRLISQGGIKINKEKITHNVEINLDKNQTIILQIGKINFVKIIPE